MRKLFITILLMFSIISLNAQIRGTVKDKTGETVCGAYIYSTSNPLNHAISERDGSFFIDVDPGDFINITLGNSMNQSFEVEKDDQVFVLNDDGKVMNTGFTVENRITNTMALSTVDSETLRRNNGSNTIYQSLYGTLAGLVVSQNVDWNTNPSFMIRGGANLNGRAPLIIIDGFERSLASLSMEEVENVTLLKDGAATALYGSEGANGVIVVTTKRGEYKKMHATVDYKFGMGLPYRTPEFVDAANYATAWNQALVNDGLPPLYKDAEIDAYREGYDKYNYPDVNWVDEGMRDFTTNHELNLTFQGGGDNVKYYTNINYFHDMGLLETGYVDKADRYSPQMRTNKLSARVNLDVNVTKSTLLRLNLHGCLRENHRPAGNSDSELLTRLYRLPANSFPIKTESGEWGANLNNKWNPIADINSVGYFNLYKRLLLADLRLTQDFSGWVKGLKAELAVAWDNSATFQEGNKKAYRYQVLNPSMSDHGEITNAPVVYGENTDFSYWSQLSEQMMRATFDAHIFYDRSFGRHNVDAHVIYRQQTKIPSGRNTTRKYQNIMFYGGYNYDNRYIVDIAANYFGSSVLLKGHKFSFYPAVSAAWVLSNERWLKDSSIDLLKLRLSYGRSGLTGNGYDLDKSFYVSGDSYLFGDNPASQSGMKIDRIPLEHLRSQACDKFNVGIDFSLLSKWDLTADFYKDRRSHILMSSGAIYSDVLGIDSPQANVGVVDAMGVDLSTVYHDQIGDFKYHIGGTFSFSRSKIIDNAEGILAEPYLTKKGHRVGQIFALVVDPEHPFFMDEEEITNSPSQTFSPVKPGDLKYVDQNGDNKIDKNDVQPVGFSASVPEMYYGINLGFEWKGLGFNLNFQGTANYSKFLKTPGLHRPLANGENLSRWYWEENTPWTESTKTTATLPRLSTKDNPNNNQESTFWMRDASYFSLRSAYLYYNLPQRWCKKMRMSNFQIFLKGDNLFMVDDLKYSNPDSAGSLYPDLRVCNVGLSIKF